VSLMAAVYLTLYVMSWPENIAPEEIVWACSLLEVDEAEILVPDFDLKNWRAI
jgi:hypothetical protein